MHPFSFPLEQIQKHLSSYLPTVDGWLIYDFAGSNDLARPLLGLNKDTFLSRRFYYWIPPHSDPIKIVHFIDAEFVAHLPGIPFIYSSWSELDAILEAHLKGKKQIAMEYSPCNRIPVLSKVDAGTVEWLKLRKISVVSSWPFMEPFISKFDNAQIKLHRETSQCIINAANEAFSLIRNAVFAKKNITELDIQNYLIRTLKEQNYIASHPPICAVGPHSAIPHYEPVAKEMRSMREGDFVLIDCWCKKDEPHAPYADHTFVAFIGKAPPPLMTQVYNAVQYAQENAINFLKGALKKGDVCGYQVDDIARQSIRERGFGEYFIHRTGHNIYTDVHASGANFDNFETNDTRRITPNTCYSIEPGIYIPDAFGVRLECNVLITEDLSVEVTAEACLHLPCLLSL